MINIFGLIINYRLKTAADAQAEGIPDLRMSCQVRDVQAKTFPLGTQAQGQVRRKSSARRSVTVTGTRKEHVLETVSDTGGNADLATEVVIGVQSAGKRAGAGRQFLGNSHTGR